MFSTLANPPDWVNQLALPTLGGFILLVVGWFAKVGWDWWKSRRVFTPQETTLLVKLHRAIQAEPSATLQKRGSYMRGAVHIVHDVWESALFLQAYDSLLKDDYLTDDGYGQHDPSVTHVHTFTVKGLAAAESIIAQQRGEPMKVVGFTE